MVLDIKKKMKKLIVLAAATVSCLFTGLAGNAYGGSRNVMNIVNFVRGVEPRNPALDLVKPLAEEIKLNTKYGLPNTILLQYDAMLRADIMEIARTAQQDRTEYGVWIEIVRPLVERVGITWRGREGWAWDWHINPGFLMSYTQAEREKLIDELFRLFKEKFGCYPKSAGAWLLDAHSMDYMQRKYDVKGFCICREQDNTDAYGLRGGYFNGAYYPSKKNMLSAAVDMRNAIKAPVFKMLTPDPIYNYAESIRPNKKTVCPTMEPVWYSGQATNIVDWFFRIYTGPGNLNLSYMQTGQENSFGWDDISKGLPYQIHKIAEERSAHRLIVERMCDTAERFIADHAENCPQTQVALEDWGGDAKSIWYNSKHYRANLLLEKGKLRFRDIHKMCDDFEEPFLEKVCEGWQALYFTPPVLDEYLSKNDARWMPVIFAGEFDNLEANVADSKKLRVTARRRDGSKVTVIFNEGSVRVDGDTLDAMQAGKLTFQDFQYELQVVRDSQGMTLILSL